VLEHSIVNEILSGLTDWKAVTTIASYDLVKFIGARALERLRDPGVRRQILQYAERRLVEDGMSKAQARHLTIYVRDADLLNQGIREDVTRLETVVFTTFQASGYHPLEARAVYGALLMAIAVQLSPQPFPATMAAQTLLNTQVPKEQRETLFAFMEAQKFPERFGGQLLAQILTEAGQTGARLSVGAGGDLQLEGPVSIEMIATGWVRDRLQALPELLDQGQTLEIEPDLHGTLRLTAGHAVLDRLLHFDQGMASMKFTPEPHRFQVPLLIRNQTGIEAEIEVTAQADRAKETIDLTFVDRPEFSFRLTVAPDTISWSLNVDPAIAPVTQEDRKVLRFLSLFLSRDVRVYHSRPPQRLLRNVTRELVEVGRTARLWLDLLDLQAFLASELPAATLDLKGFPELNRSMAQVIASLGRAARDDLVNQSIEFDAEVQLTESSLRLLGQAPRAAIRLTQEVTLSGSTPLTITTVVPEARLRFRAGQHQVQRKNLGELLGQSVQVSFTGTVSEATIGIQEEPLI